VHGSNGSGKTNFVQDAIKLVNQNDPTKFIVYIDCVEFYSEKLISIIAS